MKTKEEILNKVSEIIDTSKDKQITLNACHFLYNAIYTEELQAKLDKEKEYSKQKAMKFNEPLAEMLKSLVEV